MRRNRSSRSPLKKMLIKKIVSYYDTLDRSRSMSKTRSPKKKSFKKSLMTPKKKRPTFMKEKNQDYYLEESHRNTKLDKLGDLMEKELNELESPIEQTPKERTLEDDPLLGSISKKPTIEVLKEKVIYSKEHPAPPGESDIEEEKIEEKEQEDDIFDKKLYHLNTKKNYIHVAPGQQDQYDFHQRKSKEIRRLQYVASLGRKKPKPRRPKTRELFYGIWVVYKRRAYEAQLCKTVIEGKEGINEDGVLEVVSGDFVKVKVGRTIFKNIDEFEGECEEKGPEDGECDFVVQAPDGFRYPILINFRNLRKVRDVEDTNCDAYGLDDDADLDNLGLEQDPKNNENLDFLGRGKLTIFEDGKPAVYHKAYLLTPDNDINLALIHHLGENKILMKSSKNSKTEETVVINQTLKIDGIEGVMTILTLKEDDEVKIPRQVYYIQQLSVLQSSELLHGEDVHIVCEDGYDYRGILDHDNLGPGLKLMLSEEKQQELEEEWIRVVIDDIVAEDLEDYIDIQNFHEIVNKLAKNRISGPWILKPQTKEMGTFNDLSKPGKDFNSQTEDKGLSAMGLDFIKLGIVDSAGRKMVVQINNQEQANDQEGYTFDSFQGSNLGDSLENGQGKPSTKKLKYKEEKGNFGPDYNRITMEVEVDEGKQISLENFRKVSIVKKDVKKKFNLFF